MPVKCISECVSVVLNHNWSLLSYSKKYQILLVTITDKILVTANYFLKSPVRFLLLFVICIQRALNRTNSFTMSQAVLYKHSLLYFIRRERVGQQYIVPLHPKNCLLLNWSNRSCQSALENHTRIKITKRWLIPALETTGNEGPSLKANSFI